MRESGLEVTSLCRGGFLTAASAEERAAALADNRQAVLEAAGVGTDVLILVVGGLPSGSKDLPAARTAVAEAIADLAPFAAEHGVKLAIEPLHPMFCADRAVVSTLGQALDIAEAFPAEQVGVVVDTYHVWWDPQLEASIARAGRGNRILSYQECDWVVPLPADMLLGRGHVGDGHIDFARMRRLVTAAGLDRLRRGRDLQPGDLGRGRRPDHRHRPRPPRGGQRRLGSVTARRTAVRNSDTRGPGPQAGSAVVSQGTDQLRHGDVVVQRVRRVARVVVVVVGQGQRVAVRRR